jgi:mono/diheme cytochrome c family protein
LFAAYDVIELPIPTQMDSQVSIAYVEGPRRAAPEGAIPVQGPAFIGGRPASEPLPPTNASLQRGAILFDINCALCHGEAGEGNGPLADYFTPHPANLSDEEVQSMPSNTLFQIISYGRGMMPGLYENLTPEDRWDVINHVRTLAKGTEQ